MTLYHALIQRNKYNKLYIKHCQFQAALTLRSLNTVYISVNQMNLMSHN
jgi:hypothetical protein